MQAKPTLADLLELSPAERLLLVEELWDSLMNEPDAVPHTDAQREKLDRRLEAHRCNPNAGSSWEEVKARVLGKG
jgi:putative addiction module component (TIGR02574 family)